MLSSTSTEHLATKADVDDLSADLDVAVATLRNEIRDAIYEQGRTYTTWMFGLLTVYTAMAGSLVAIGMLFIGR